MTSFTASGDAASGVLADLIPRTRVREVALVAGFALAIAVSAQIAFVLPFTPVPVTGQTFAVLLGAAALGARRAALGSSLFLVLGITGVPWFAVTGGATFGYIVGFVLAAAVVGRLAERGNDRTVGRAAVLMVLGNLLIYACGVPVLAVVVGVDLQQAIMLGVVPFLAGDLAKIALAVLLLPAAWRMLGERNA